MMVMIGISKKRLSDAYRRLIFGICFVDISHSIAVTFKVFKTMPDPNIWASLGNRTSCNVLGFIHLFGVQASAMYAVSLTIYYLYVIKHNVREAEFSRKIEPWLHFVPIVWNLFAAGYVVATDNMQPAMTGGCWIRQNDSAFCYQGDNDCYKKRKTAVWLNMIFSAMPLLISLLANLGLLTHIWFVVRRQEKHMDKHRMKRVSFCMKNELESTVRTPRIGSTPTPKLSSAFSTRPSRWSRRTPRTPIKSREFLYRAAWYFLSFFATFFFSVLSHSLKLATGKNSPYVIVLLSRIFGPLQGVFNIFVYTMPHVRKKRKFNQDWSWFRAFYAVIRLGGDDDKEDNQQRVANRITSRAKKRKSQAQMSRKSAMTHWSTRHYDRNVDNKNGDSSKSSEVNCVLPPPPCSLISSPLEEQDSSMSCDSNVHEFEIDNYGNEYSGGDLETIQEVMHAAHYSSKVNAKNSFGFNLPLCASRNNGERSHRLEENGGLELHSQDDFEGGQIVRFKHALQEHALKDSLSSITNTSTSASPSIATTQVNIGNGPKITDNFDVEKEASLWSRKYYKSALIELSNRPCTNEGEDVEKAIYDVKDSIAGDDISNRIVTSI
eukprot:CAMPEP_0194121734 /NCGR_PEP_ID=MMETSP0150-20130528/48247_1 /TAXON_ID=122233 /ORGANISM="Chaetoceros debilis, Strain MM31A-1" /LENGTH=604 /DNA_ID=CAMNT_0038814319 /DNA_START=287 /DNA_END=2101 /DNA_ORIENTATION=-